MPSKDGYKIYDILAFAGPDEAFAEALSLPGRMGMPELRAELDSLVKDVHRLFAGTYPGYRASNTAYHDLHHTASVVLALARLMHGAFLEGVRITPRRVYLGLAAALFHDVGLIQAEDDLSGTGAKYTIGHELRSIAFMKRYFEERGLPRAEVESCATMISSTILSLEFAAIPFADEEDRLLGSMLGTADLLAQMSDRLYLEKLVLLYMEFEEAHVPGYDSEEELFFKTEAFYNQFVKRRLETELGGVDRYLQPHFSEHRQVDRNLYAEYIRKNITYLSHVLQTYGTAYRDQLRRGGIVQEVEA